MDYAAISPILPELVLAIGAMAALMLGVFTRGTDGNARVVVWFVIGLMLVAAGMQVMMSGTQTAFGSAFVSDPVTRFLKILMLVSAAATLAITVETFSREKILLFEYPVLMLLACVGMSMMISANDLIALYLGIELHSLAVYVIAAFKRDDVRSSEAGIKYFVLGALASGILLYGASLIYGVAGGTSYAAIAKAAAAEGMAQNIGLIMGLVFILVALAFKIGAVPFHMWTPDVYQGAPTPVTAFLAGSSKVSSVALILRFVGIAVPGIAPQWQQILIFLSIASMALGAFAAIGQTSIKRLLAYSSIGHVGYLLMAIAANNAEGDAGVLIYIAIYVAMTLGTFACVLAMRRKGGNVENISDLAGLAKTDLRMATIFGLLMFSLAGIPPLAGFWAKWYVFLPAIEAGLYPLAVIGVLTSVVGAFYYLRIIKIMFFDDAAEPFLKADRATLAVMVFSGLFIVTFVLPFVGGSLVDAAMAAAAAFKGAPH